MIKRASIFYKGNKRNCQGFCTYLYNGGSSGKWSLFMSSRPERLIWIFIFMPSLVTEVTWAPWRSLCPLRDAVIWRSSSPFGASCGGKNVGATPRKIWSIKNSLFLKNIIELNQWDFSKKISMFSANISAKNCHILIWNNNYLHDVGLCHEEVRKLVWHFHLHVVEGMLGVQSHDVGDALWHV